MKRVHAAALTIMVVVILLADVDGKKANAKARRRRPSLMRRSIDGALDSAITRMVLDVAITDRVEESQPYKNIMYYLVEQGADFKGDPNVCQGLDPNGKRCCLRKFWEWVQFMTKEPGWFAKLWEAAFNEKWKKSDPPKSWWQRGKQVFFEIIRVNKVAQSKGRMDPVTDHVLLPAIGIVGSVTVIEAIRAASHAVAPGPDGVLDVPRNALQGAISGSVRIIQTMLVRFIIVSFLKPYIDLMLSDHYGTRQSMVDAADGVIPDGPLIKGFNKTFLIRIGLKRFAPYAAMSLATQIVNYVVARLFRLVPGVGLHDLPNVVKTALWTATIAIVVDGARNAAKTHTSGVSHPARNSHGQ
ncbi:Uncharacterized protein PBTT_04375 [Plasmodiophora brassicae]|uniref:Uncharacterized protein n=1 Tax=Plasmodiophora brassicae TaxID=37360 RepID=A0A0G4IGF4_PLABS|nr:hypothetical protein PBRA_000043 [Plasmodiophora brassicae]SPQ96619.1 unnamed protein product [Plasmodiophora brassicae]